MLQIDDVSRAYGGVYANREISMTVEPGEVRGVIGPNGAGKSTLFSLISGQQRPMSGRILLDGVRIDTLPPHRRARLGIATVFQRSRLIPGLSLVENVAIGAHARTSAGPISAALRTPRQRREESALLERATRALDQVGLSGWVDRDPATLPLGQQRRAQVARALAAEPRLLLLDEPASGLRADEREDLIALVGGLRAQGVTILLIEHDVSMVTRLSDRVTVLDLGRVIAEGTPAQISNEPAVIAAYLGTEASDAEGD